MGSVELPSTRFKGHQPVERRAYALTTKLDPLLEIPMAVTAELARTQELESYAVPKQASARPARRQDRSPHEHQPGSEPPSVAVSKPGFPTGSRSIDLTRWLVRTRWPGLTIDCGRLGP